jgi:hypothetical protein
MYTMCDIDIDAMGEGGWWLRPHFVITHVAVGSRQWQGMLPLEGRGGA